MRCREEDVEFCHHCACVHSTGSGPCDRTVTEWGRAVCSVGAGLCLEGLRGGTEAGPSLVRFLKTLRPGL